jgi:hypothetical protein
MAFAWTKAAIYVPHVMLFHPVNERSNADAIRHNLRRLSLE